MSWFDKFNKAKMPSDDEIRKSIDAFDSLWKTDINDIWKISDVNSFMTAMNGWICRKCNYGTAINALTAQEQTIYYTLQLEAEVNNGGFSQYFYNAFGDVANALVSSFEAINAEKTAAICKKAICAFPTNIPSDRVQREEFFDKISTDRIGEILSECNNEFYLESDNLEELNYQFIMKHKACFC